MNGLSHSLGIPIAVVVEGEDVDVRALECIFVKRG